jgi:branched-chain amino acid transport system permease protein
LTAAQAANPIFAIAPLRLPRPLITGVASGALLLFVQQQLWPAPAGVVVHGALVGGLTALIALGISLVYRANRIINFAQGDLGGLPATLSVLLIVSTGLNYFAALAIGLAAAVLLGAIIEVVVIRRFLDSPRLILTVATIGLSQVLAAGGLLLPQAFHLTVPPQDYRPPFEVAINFGGVTFRGNDVIAAAVIPLAFILLALFLRRTASGTAIRAAADDADRARLLGIDVGRLHTLVWIIATVLSSTAMFLRAGIVGLPIGTVLGPAIALQALAACVIGKMDRLVVVAGAAIGLGVIEQTVAYRGHPDYIDPILFIVILAALLLGSRSSSLARSDRRGQPANLAGRPPRPLPAPVTARPGVRRARLGLGAAAAVVLLVLPALVPTSTINLVAAGVIFAIIALSLVILTGWAGQVSLGQMAFVGIGAAIAGWVTTHLGWDLLVTVVIAGLVGAAIAVVIGLPALRMQGLELAVMTLALALATSNYLLNPKYFGWLPTGRIPRQPVLGVIGIRSEARFYYLTVGALLLALLAVTGVRRSRTGRVLIAVRDNPAAAAAYGIRPSTTVLTAFALAGFVAAAAGALFIHQQQSLGVSPYAPAESLAAFSMVVVGGLASVSGAILGAAYVRGADWLLPGQYRILATGAGLLAVLIILPQGLSVTVYRARDRMLRRWTTPAADTTDEAAALADAPTVTGPEPVTPPATGTARPAKPGSPGTNAALLSLRGVHAGYGTTTVLLGVDLDVHPGEIVALLGTNGAGKSTLLGVASGLIRPTAGTIMLDGVDLAHTPAHRVAARGVRLLPGGSGVFGDLTVAENLSLASWLARRGRSGGPDAASALSDFPELAGRLGAAAGELSGGQQQMLALAMVLIDRPRLLMIDELSLGLSPMAVEQVLAVVTRLRAEGTAILLVEQSANLALSLSDTAVFLEKGTVRFRGPAAALGDRDDLLRSVFLGNGGADHREPGRSGASDSETTSAPTSGGPVGPVRTVGTVADGEPVPTADPLLGARPVLAVEHLSRRFGGVTALDDVTLSVGPGEILGLIGANGAGKTTLFDVISGLVDPDHGAVTLSGADLTRLSPSARAARGLGRSFQDSRLFSALTVAETIAVAFDLHTEVRDPVAAALRLPAVSQSERRVWARVDELCALLHLDAVATAFVDELSTGTRRILDLACLLAQQARVLLLDEPTSGLAQPEAEALGPLLVRIRNETGAALMVIEHDITVLAGICDRMVAMDAGRVIAAGLPGQVLHHPDVLGSYLGPGDSSRPRSGPLTATESRPR